MIVLYLSPGFPPGSDLFCVAANARGATVLGVGDVPECDLPLSLASVLRTYRFEPGMHEYAVLHRTVAELVARYGRIDRVESNGEHWLEVEGRLRDDFGIHGLSAADVRRLRSKLAMAGVFRQGGIPCPAGIRNESNDVVHGFAREHGYPLVWKPDSGSGALHTFRVDNERELDAALARPLSGHIIQPFVAGDIVTFDGLVNRNGEIVFFTSHVYDAGIMQVRTGELDGHYYSVRDVPPALEALGRRAVGAFALRERFFHLEFFAQPSGDYTALELNVRPPGGFTTDLMNYACDMDVYDLWAAVLTGHLLEGFTYERTFYTAHAGRRARREYRLPAEALTRELGTTLVATRPVPPAFASTMGDTAYLLRHPDLPCLKNAIRQVQALQDASQ